MVEVIKIARDRIPTFAGMKYTHNDLTEYQQCLRASEGSLDIFFGRDEILYAAVAAGARAAVGSTYNYAAPVYLRLIEATNAGNLPSVREHQSRVIRLVEVLRKFGDIPAAKAIMTMLDVPCGPARTPLPKLNERHVQSIFAELAGLDVFVRPLRSV
jgi:N-acetylneuraminate lyase